MNLSQGGTLQQPQFRSNPEGISEELKFLNNHYWFKLENVSNDNNVIAVCIQGEKVCLVDGTPTWQKSPTENWLQCRVFICSLKKNYKINLRVKYFSILGLIVDGFTCVRNYWCPCVGVIFKIWSSYGFVGVDDFFLFFSMILRWGLWILWWLISICFLIFDLHWKS